MQHILVYSDSLSWGIVPLTRARLPFERSPLFPADFPSRLGFDVDQVESVPAA